MLKYMEVNKTEMDDRYKKEAKWKKNLNHFF
jgi:hypothetical protein